MTRYKLVPVEPTAEQLEAGEAQSDETNYEIYAAMVKAAPPLLPSRAIEIAEGLERLAFNVPSSLGVAARAAAEELRSVEARLQFLTGCEPTELEAMGMGISPERFEARVARLGSPEQAVAGMLDEIHGMLRFLCTDYSDLDPEGDGK